MDILMPQLGETVAEGKVSVWFKKVGDKVVSGDNLFEIETDKTSMEVPATSDGVLTEIRVQEGETVPVGVVVAVVSGAGAAAAPSTPTPAAATPAAKAAPAAPAKASAAPVAASAAAPRPMKMFDEVHTPDRNWGPARVGNALVSPLARRLAGMRGIDLTRLQGTGPRGRIVAKDVESAPAAAPRGIAAQGASSSDVMAIYRNTPYEEVALDGMRKTIASRLTQSKQTVPHFYLKANVDISGLLKGRKELNDLAAANNKENPVRISVNDFIIKALALALRQVPEANAVWAEDRVLRFSQSDVGVAVAIEGGLITPVVRNADAKSLGAISAEMKDIAARARARKLKPEEYSGGASAISNLGMYGVQEFSAIINPPQASILAVGGAYRAPLENADGSVRFTDQLTVTLSVDHRVIDGAVGALLLKAIKGYLEQPLTMLV